MTKKLRLFYISCKYLSPERNPLWRSSMVWKHNQLFFKRPYSYLIHNKSFVFLICCGTVREPNFFLNSFALIVALFWRKMLQDFSVFRGGFQFCYFQGYFSNISQIINIWMLLFGTKENIGWAHYSFKLGRQLYSLSIQIRWVILAWHWMEWNGVVYNTIFY